MTMTSNEIQAEHKNILSCWSFVHFYMYIFPYKLHTPSKVAFQGSSNTKDTGRCLINQSIAECVWWWLVYWLVGWFSKHDICPLFLIPGWGIILIPGGINMLWSQTHQGAPESGQLQFPRMQLGGGGAPPSPHLMITRLTRRAMFFFWVRTPDNVAIQVITVTVNIEQMLRSFLYEKRPQGFSLHIQQHSLACSGSLWSQVCCRSIQLHIVLMPNN